MSRGSHGQRVAHGHAEHGDQHGTDPIWRGAAGFDAPEDPELDDDVYGVAGDEDPET